MSEENEDLKPNFTMVPNVMFDSWQANLSPSAFSCLMVVARKTYGWQKKTDAIAQSQFEGLTGMSKNTVKAALKELLTEKILKIVADPTNFKATKYGLNMKIRFRGSESDSPEGQDLTVPEGQDLTVQNKANKIKEKGSAQERAASPPVNDILKMIYDGTENKQSLFTDHRIRKLVEKAIESDGMDALTASLTEYLADPWMKEKRAYNFTKFFHEKAVREKYKPRSAAVKVAQKTDVHWLDNPEYTDEKKTEILAKGMLQGNLLPTRWTEWEKKICEHLTRGGYSTSEILKAYREKEASARTAKTQNARMAS